MLSWSKHRIAGGLVKDLVAPIHDLDVLRCPDITIRIGRGAVTVDAWERDAVKVKTRDYTA